MILPPLTAVRLHFETEWHIVTFEILFVQLQFGAGTNRNNDFNDQGMCAVALGVKFGYRPPPGFYPTGLAPSSRPDSHSTSDALTPTTPTSSSHNRLGGAPSVNIISGLASGPGMDHMKAGGLAGLLGPPPKAPRGRKKIKAENPSGPLLVVPYPILADQGCVTVAPKEGKTYRSDTGSCHFFSS